jgi:hypothetical protein
MAISTADAIAGIITALTATSAQAAASSEKRAPAETADKAASP